MDLDFLDLEEFSDISVKNRQTERPAIDRPAVDRPAVDRHVANHHDQLKNRRKYLFILFIILKLKKNNFFSNKVLF